MFIGNSTTAFASATLSSCDQPGTLNVDFGLACKKNGATTNGVQINFTNNTDTDASFKVTADGVPVDYYGKNTVEVARRSAAGVATSLPTVLEVQEDTTVHLVVTEDKSGYSKDQIITVDCESPVVGTSEPDDNTQVLGEQISNDQPQVSPALAFTGANTVGTMTLGSVFTLFGLALLAVASRVRNRTRRLASAESAS